MAKAELRRNRKNVWFKPLRGSYLPVNWKGWAMYLPFVAYLDFSVRVAFWYTGTTLKATLWIIPNWVAAAAVLTWVARRKS